MGDLNINNLEKNLYPVCKYRDTGLIEEGGVLFTPRHALLYKHGENYLKNKDNYYFINCDNDIDNIVWTGKKKICIFIVYNDSFNAFKDFCIKNKVVINVAVVDEAQFNSKKITKSKFFKNIKKRYLFTETPDEYKNYSDNLVKYFFKRLNQ
jgi:hypothetical protein